MNEQIEQFGKDLKPDDKSSNELKDAIAYYMNVQNPQGSIEKEAIFKQIAHEAKSLGKTVGGGALLGGGVNMIRATGHDDPIESTGQKIKRYAGAGAQGALGGAVIGAGVHGIQRGAALKKVAGIGSAIEGAAGHIEQGAIKAKNAIKPHLVNAGQGAMNFVNNNPAVIGGMAGAGLGAAALDNYGNGGVAPAIGAAGGALAGSQLGPKLLAKIAMNVKRANLMTGALGAIGKGIAKHPRVAAGLAGAGIGGAASSAAGGDFTTGAAIGGVGGAAFGGKKLLGAVSNKAKPLLGKSVQQGAVGELGAARNAVRAAKAPGVASEVAHAGGPAMSGEAVAAHAPNPVQAEALHPAASQAAHGMSGAETMEGYSPLGAKSPTMTHSYSPSANPTQSGLNSTYGTRNLNNGTASLIQSGPKANISQAYSGPSGGASIGATMENQAPLAKDLAVRGAYQQTPGGMTGLSNPTAFGGGTDVGGRMVDQIAPQGISMPRRGSAIDPEVAKRLAYGVNPYGA